MKACIDCSKDSSCWSFSLLRKSTCFKGTPAPPRQLAPQEMKEPRCFSSLESKGRGRAGAWALRREWLSTWPSFHQTGEWKHKGCVLPCTFSSPLLLFGALVIYFFLFVFGFPPEMGALCLLWFEGMNQGKNPSFPPTSGGAERERKCPGPLWLAGTLEFTHSYSMKASGFSSFFFFKFYIEV